ncbi:MAG: hypothetical protein VKK62_03140 [Synechococcaceae cyanobacterium]|nr:hypothetical protein [Synechococcaceae cyanobacterium]
MNKRDLVVSTAVLLLCGGLLVLFTDIEVGLVRWVNCGPIGGAGERSSEVCR